MIKKIISSLLFVMLVIFIQYQCFAASETDSVSLNNELEHGAFNMTLEQMLDVLSDAGFKLADPLTVNDLLDLFDREDYEKDGFESVIFGLATGIDEDVEMNRCVNLANIDLEIIYGDGSYLLLAERMLEMSQGSLVFDNMRDHVDEDNGEAWFAFTYEGQEYRYNLKVDNDWADPDFFGIFCEFLEKSDPDKVYVVYDSDGQNVIIGCITKEEFSFMLENGIKFGLLCQPGD